MSWTQGITEERDVKKMPGRAGAAVELYRILQAGTLGYEVIQATAGTQFPIGVSGNDSENVDKLLYESGDEIAIKYDGIVYIKMSGTGARGDRVMATTGGKGLKHATSDGVYIIGHSTVSWVDGDVIPVMIDRYLISNFENS